MVKSVSLVSVSKDNIAAILALQLANDQLNLVASNWESLEEAEQDEDARPRAIVADNRVVGFLMYDATSDDNNAQIYRFMIDKSCQGRGYGYAALQMVIEEIAQSKAIDQISICFEPENLGAKNLYAKAGFVEVGIDEDGEMIAVLKLIRFDADD